MVFLILGFFIAIMVPPFLLAREQRERRARMPGQHVLPVLPRHPLPPALAPVRGRPVVLPVPQAGSSSSSSEKPQPEEPQPVEPQFHPSPGDIKLVREMLCEWTTIPVEVVNEILDYAEYWAHSSNEIDFNLEHQSHLRISGTSPSKNKFLLRSYPVGITQADGQKHLADELAYDTTEARPWPLASPHKDAYFNKLADYQAPLLEAPVRKVVFTIKSKDQGWGGRGQDHGTYQGSYTWFEAGLEKFDAADTCDPQCVYDVRFRSTETVAPPLPVCTLRPILPPLEKSENPEFEYQYSHPLHGEPNVVIQRNVMAGKQMKEHVVTWSWLDDISPDSPEAESLDQQGRGKATGDGSFVRNLRVGDVITVWGKARFGGWVNHVEKVKIDIYWVV